MPMRPMNRRIGLNKHQRPPRLLSTVPNRETQDSKSRSTNVKGQASAPKMGRDVRIREPESITAPPEDSDEEEEDYKLLRRSAHDESHDTDSDDNKVRRGDIKPTTFSSIQSPPHRSNTRRSTRGQSKPSSQERYGTSNARTDEPSSSAGSKRSAEAPSADLGSHLTDGYGFTMKKPTGSKRTTYGGRPSHPKSSQMKSSQGSVPRSSAPQLGKDYSPPSKRFKRFKTSPGPEHDLSPPAPQFKNPGSITPENIKSSKTFIRPQSLADSTPESDIKKPMFRRSSLSSVDSPAKSKFKLFDPDEESDVSLGAKLNQRLGRTDSMKKSKAKKRKSSSESAAEELSQRPTFKVHTLDDLDYLDDSDDNIAVVFEDRCSGDEAGDISIQSLVADTARCPMCHEEVDGELLAKYSDRGRMNIRKQTAFCRLHKRQTALDSRSQKGYPKINWEALDKRLDTHQDLLKEILEGSQQSHYREVLQRKVEAGKNRTLLKTEDSLTPGYYGPRGLRVMTEYIMRTLSSVVRKRAVEDRLVSARGYTGYVQAVLVPELATRLIMEDMSVVEEDAREIMQESIEVGELLYEDAGDVVATVSDEEDEL